MKLFRSAYLALASSALPLVAWAQTYFPGGGGPQYYYGGGGVGGYYGNTGFGGYNGQTRGAGVTNLQSLLSIVQTLIGYFQVIIFLVSIFYILKAALSFARGVPAWEPIKFAVYGILIALLAFSVIPLACWITQSSGPACNL